MTFIQKINIFSNFWGTTLYQNILQKALNCIIFENFLVGACPRSSLADAYENTPTFLKSNLTPFPPYPRNEDLDTPPPRCTCNNVCCNAVGLPSDYLR